MQVSTTNKRVDFPTIETYLLQRLHLSSNIARNPTKVPAREYSRFERDNGQTGRSVNVVPERETYLKDNGL